MENTHSRVGNFYIYIPTQLGNITAGARKRDVKKRKFSPYIHIIHTNHPKFRNARGRYISFREHQIKICISIRYNDHIAKRKKFICTILALAHEIKIRRAFSSAYTQYSTRRSRDSSKLRSPSDYTLFAFSFVAAEAHYRSK